MLSAVQSGGVNWRGHDRGPIIVDFMQLQRVY